MAPKEPSMTISNTQNLGSEQATHIYDPSLFIQARESKSLSGPGPANTNGSTSIVAGRIYEPSLIVDINDTDSIINVALHIIFHNDNNFNSTTITTDEKFKTGLDVKKVVGGMTNALFRISGLSPKKDYNSVLLRIFGAEGMIDRDVETCTFAALSDKKIAPPYYGRFGNGRVEGWLDNYQSLNLPDFQNEITYLEIATKMAELHSGFTVPDELKKYHDEKEPGLWDQLFCWMKQAQEITIYKTHTDNERAASLLDLDTLEKECHWVKSHVPKSAKVGFSHNDLLPANIMKHSTSGDVKFIDFEYGGVNYITFDIANHFNEWAGGIQNNEGKTDYSLFPSEEKRKDFVIKYMQTASGSTCVSEDDLKSMMIEVEAFLLANHLYWGLWAVNQAAIEGTDGFDYLAYGVNRFNRYFETKTR